MRELLLVRYGEIFLKGLNRPYFMRALTDRVRKAAQKYDGHVWLHDGRVFVSDMTDREGCARDIARVFGVHSVCFALEMEKTDFQAICDQGIRMMKDLKGSFRVNSRRSDKLYPMDSPAINAEMGGAVLKACPQLRVDLHHPDHTLNVEIRDACYLYVRILPAVGGMPVGTNGKAMLLLSGGIDSPVAGYMIAKRGVKLAAIHFHSYPYTSDRAKEKVLDLARILSSYACGIRVYVVPFTEIQMQIHEKCPEEYSTLIMRRFMMRIAQDCAKKDGSQALVTGESIGQVASQTMEALQTTNDVVTLPVFRPLIGFDKAEIIEIAQKIETFETSSLPYEDCCTVFTPRHPVTKPKVDRVRDAEKTLDGETLIQRAEEGIEIIDIP